MSASSRAALMQKLAGRADVAPMPITSNLGSSNQIPLGVPSWGVATVTGSPSAVRQERSILLRNMFSPEDARADDEFERDMTQDVAEECQKYGRVQHIKVDKNSMGLVYLKFESVVAGAAALNGLNGRWFGGKMVAAEFVPEAQYNSKFGISD